MKLSKESIACSLDHIVAKGDTDIFPYPFETRFLQQSRDIVVEKLSTIDIHQHHPMSLVESLIPKTKFGFRVAHQAFAIDIVLYTSLVLTIFDSVENGRDAAESNRAFSYRKKPGFDAELFLPERTYKKWLDYIEGIAFFGDYKYAIRADISDFYARIYRHRLENILESLSGNSQVVKSIERFISYWRGGQSFGLPVGSNASRLLAEAAMNDTDFAMISEGIEHTRFVDDILIFVRGNQDAYAVLAFLARHLSENEGLSLNSQKTRIIPWEEFRSAILSPSAEDDHSTNEFATERLFWAAYGNNDVDPKALEALMLKDLSKELEGLLSEQFWDMGQNCASCNETSKESRCCGIY
jgi:hypothetical protein